MGWGGGGQRQAHDSVCEAVRSTALLNAPGRAGDVLEIQCSYVTDIPCCTARMVHRLCLSSQDQRCYSTAMCSPSGGMFTLLRGTPLSVRFCRRTEVRPHPALLYLFVFLLTFMLVHSDRLSSCKFLQSPRRHQRQNSKAAVVG